MKKISKGSSKKILEEILSYIVLVIAIVAILGIAFRIIGLYRDAETPVQSTAEALDTIDREYSIEYLSQTKGKIETIEHLAHRVNADEEALAEELLSIVVLANKYYFGEDSPALLLKDFTLAEPGDTSDIRDYCEILIKQIDDQISDIRFGKADA